MKIIAIANQKGGTAKTTTAAVLGLLFSRSGWSTHLIDMDPQAALTAAFGQRDRHGVLYDALRNSTRLPVIRLAERLTLTPSSIDLSRGETEFLSQFSRELLLKRSLEKSAISQKTVVIVDCPPSLGVLAVNCLSAAQTICIVVQPGGFEVKALLHLRRTVERLQERVNPQLTFAGAVLTNCHSRRRITAQVEAEVRRHYRLLGRARMDSKLLYATTSGRLLALRKSAAIEDYAVVLRNFTTVWPWAETQSKA